MNDRSTDPYAPPDFERPASADAASTKRSITAIEVVVIVAIVAVLVALLLPLLQQARVYSPRISCKNNLKQFGLALHNYHDVYDGFPPVFVVGQDGKPAHSWRILILPFMDRKHQELYEAYRFDEPWDGPHNSTLHNQMPHCYACPAFLQGVDRKSPEGLHLSQLTNYVAINSVDGVFNGSRSRSLCDVQDATSETLMVAGVRQHAVHWLSPVDVTPSQLLTDLRRSVSEENSNHLGGLQMLRVDGTVRHTPHDTAESVIRAAITINGGEEIPEGF